MSLLFACLFAIGVGVLIYVYVGETMYSRPWKLLLLAFGALLVPFVFTLAVNGLANVLDTMQPKVHHLADLKLGLQLISLVSGGFGGALIGAAVSGRALKLHNAKVAALLQSLDVTTRERDALMSQKRLIHIQQSYLPSEEYKSKLDAVDRLISKHIIELQELRQEMDKYVV